MIWGIPLMVLLAAGTPRSSAAREELDAVATRIEQLKARHMAGQDVGRELVRLLVRAQELAAQIDREEARAPLPTPELADELRERADALHDEADRLAAALASLDMRIAHAHRAMAARPAGRGGQPEPQLVGQAVVARNAGLAPHEAAPAADEARVRALLAERQRLAAVLAEVRAEAAAAEAEAQAAGR